MPPMSTRSGRPRGPGPRRCSAPRSAGRTSAPECRIAPCAGAGGRPTPSPSIARREGDSRSRRPTGVSCACCTSISTRCAPTISAVTAITGHHAEHRRARRRRHGFANVYASDVPCLPSRAALCRARSVFATAWSTTAAAPPNCGIEGADDAIREPLRVRVVGRSLLLERLAHRVDLELPVPALGDVVEPRLHGGHEPHARHGRRAGRPGPARCARLAGATGPRRRLVPARAPLGPAHAVQHAGRLRQPLRFATRCPRGTPRTYVRATGSSPARTRRRSRGGSRPTSGDRHHHASRGTRSSMDAVKAIFDGYDVGIRYADDALGTLVNKLDDLGVLDDTAVLVSSDHGEAFGELGVYADHQAADEATCHIPGGAPVARDRATGARRVAIPPRRRGHRARARRASVPQAGMASRSTSAAPDATTSSSRRERGRASAASGSATTSTCAPGTTATTGTGPTRCSSTSCRDPHETNDLGHRAATTGGASLLDEWTAAQLARTGLDDPMDTCAQRGRPVPRTQAPRAVHRAAAGHGTRPTGPSSTTPPHEI